MTKQHPDRAYLGERVHLYFAYISDEELRKVSTAINQEISLRVFEKNMR